MMNVFLRGRLHCLRQVAAFMIALVSGAVCVSCTSSSFVKYTQQNPINPKTDGQYDVTGYVHARDWTTCFFFVAPVGSDLDYRSGSEINRPNVGDVGPVSLHTENYTLNPAIAWAHYGGFFPFVVGSKCNYISATYVMPKTQAAGAASK